MNKKVRKSKRRTRAGRNTIGRKSKIEKAEFEDPESWNLESGLRLFN